MRRILFVLLIMVFSLSIIFATENPMTNRPITPVYFFYSSTCGQCKQMKDTLGEILAVYPNLPIRMFNVDIDAQVWENTCKAYNIPPWGVPRIFIGKKIFAGWFSYEGGLLYY
ncbi:MAG: thioredoxin family protein, partial [Sphaerochaetaceae bacterium]|nr:thioredoxin family protein [Sphaerochaetaceae bacterium]